MTPGRLGTRSTVCFTPRVDREAALQVLFADDDEAFRHLLRVRLAQLSELEIVAEAADGAEAVKLDDVAMPRLDGFGAATLIQESLPQATVVMHSAEMTPTPHPRREARVATSGQAAPRRDTARDRTSANEIPLGQLAPPVTRFASSRFYARSRSCETPSSPAQCAQQKIRPFDSTPCPITRQPQWAQIGASAWIAHSKLSKV